MSEDTGILNLFPMEVEDDGYLDDMECCLCFEEEWWRLLVVMIELSVLRMIGAWRCEKFLSIQLFSVEVKYFCTEESLRHSFAMSMSDIREMSRSTRSW